MPSNRYGQILLLFLLALPLLLQAQDYRRARIHAPQPAWGKITQLGIALDHVALESNSILGDFSIYEIELLQKEGYEIEILHEDAEKFYRNTRKTSTSREQTNCPDLESIFNFERPVNFRFGSMKGHPTYSEMMTQLESMANLYPHLITKGIEIGNFRTEEDRPIHYFKISDNPNSNEEEPQILYTALHHAREPVSMTQMLYYMWFMLENYEENPRIRQIVNSTEMFFVPCVNPDGYIYNETTNPTGGGLWRKNRRSLGQDKYGVDLNRNYGFKWGLDNLGSSPNPDSETYRGEAPFSEPETQAIKHLTEANNFRLALNYHAWGNFLIYPLGYTSDPPPDLDIFQNIGDLLTMENRYLHGNGFETVSYFTNGDSDDWMYLGLDEEPILSFTPEVGNETQGFWPAIQDVELLCKSVLNQNINAAFFLLNTGLLVDESARFITTKSGQLPYRITKFGFEEVGLQISVKALSNNFTLNTPAKFYILDLFATQEDHFEFILDDDIQDGEEILIGYTINNGTYEYTDTLRKFYREPNFALQNDGNLNDWRAEGILASWAPVTSTYYSAPTSLTDSPLGNYFPLSSNDLVYDRPIDLSQGDSAVLYFQARWDIQPILDYMTFDVSVDNGPYVPQCGLFTRPGGPRQLQGKPVYSGRQLTWVHEHIDLTEYIGQNIKIRFSMNSTSNDSRDGIYIDDIKLLIYDKGIISTSYLVDESDFSLEIYPNPANESVQLDSKFGPMKSQPELIEVWDAYGQKMVSRIWQEHEQLNTTTWPAGHYHVRLLWENGLATRSRRLVVVH